MFTLAQFKKNSLQGGSSQRNVRRGILKTEINLQTKPKQNRNHRGKKLLRAPFTRYRNPNLRTCHKFKVGDKNSVTTTTCIEVTQCFRKWGNMWFETLWEKNLTVSCRQISFLKFKSLQKGVFQTFTTFSNKMFTRNCFNWSQICFVEKLTQQLLKWK